MKEIKQNIIIVVGVIIALLLIIFLINQFINKVPDERERDLGLAMQPNLIDGLIRFSTTTGSWEESAPVKLLDKNFDRIYALIVNDSDTTIYLVATVTPLFLTFNGTDAIDPFDGSTGTFATSTLATSTIDVLNGIRLNPNGGSYEILPENMVFGEVWATSTGQGKNIIVSHK